MCFSTFHPLAKWLSITTQVNSNCWKQSCGGRPLIMDFVISMNEYLCNQTWYNKCNYIISLRINCTFERCQYLIMLKVTQIDENPLIIDLAIFQNLAILWCPYNTKQFISADSPSWAKLTSTNDFVVACTVVEILLCGIKLLKAGFWYNLKTSTSVGQVLWNHQAVQTKCLEYF